MKIAIICEGSPGGEDVQVLTHLASRIRPDATIACRPLGNKPSVLSDCGQVAKLLIGDGYDRVVIVWDLTPSWTQSPACRADDRNVVTKNLRDEGLDPADPRIRLVCIQHELEAWLLADGRALSSVLSKMTRRVRIRNQNRPESVSNPKGRLRKVFETQGRVYTPKDEAIKIARALPNNFGNLKRCASFKRFGAILSK